MVLQTINCVTFFHNKALFCLSLSGLREVESFITRQVIQDHAELENPANTELVNRFIRSRIIMGERELKEVQEVIICTSEKTLV